MKNFLKGKRRRTKKIFPNENFQLSDICFHLDRGFFCYFIKEILILFVWKKKYFFLMSNKWKNYRAKCLHPRNIS